MTTTDEQLDQIREYLLENGYGPIAPGPGPILAILGEDPPFTLREVCIPRIQHDLFVYSPTAAGIALLVDNVQPYRTMLDLIGMMCIPNFKTQAEECLDEIAAEEKQPVERWAGMRDCERRAAMGLEQFKQALGRRQRGPGSEGTPSTEAEDEG